MKKRPKIQKLPEDYKNIFGDKTPEHYTEAHTCVALEMQKDAEITVNRIMQISLFLEFYNITTNVDIWIKYLKFLIYINYLLYWLYVLKISLPNVHRHD